MFILAPLVPADQHVEQLLCDGAQIDTPTKGGQRGGGVLMPYL